jgi:hypothetical protein
MSHRPKGKMRIRTGITPRIMARIASNAQTNEGTKWAQKGHKTRVLRGFPGSYMATKSLYLRVTTGLTR